jgi:hypothetical protein
MGGEDTRWQKADISYQNYVAYLKRKPLPYDLSLIDLLYVSNFKGGNASIQEEEKRINLKLKAYSEIIKKVAERFGHRNLRDLNEVELKSLQKFSAEFLTLVKKDSLFCIDGFGSSYASALLHFHFPTLIPILDRRVLNGAGINAEINAQGQVIDIERYYPELIQYFHRELQKRPEKDLRTLDKELFIKPIARASDRIKSL